MTLDERLLRATKNGLLTLSLNRSWDGTEWIATYRNTDNAKVNAVSDADLLKAIEKAISPLRMPAPPVPDIGVTTKQKRKVAPKPKVAPVDDFEDLLG